MQKLSTSKKCMLFCSTALTCLRNASVICGCADGLKSLVLVMTTLLSSRTCCFQPPSIFFTIGHKWKDSWHEINSGRFCWSCYDCFHLVCCLNEITDDRTLSLSSAPSLILSLRPSAFITLIIIITFSSFSIFSLTNIIFGAHMFCLRRWALRKANSIRADNYGSKCICLYVCPWICQRLTLHFYLSLLSFWPVRTIDWIWGCVYVALCVLIVWEREIPAKGFSSLSPVSELDGEMTAVSARMCVCHRVCYKGRERRWRALIEHLGSGQCV